MKSGKAVTYRELMSGIYAPLDAQGDVAPVPCGRCHRLVAFLRNVFGRTVCLCCFDELEKK